MTNTESIKTKIEELRKHTFTNVAELIEYLNTISPDTKLRTYSKDLDGYDVSTQDHVRLSYNHSDQIIEITHCEYELWKLFEEARMKKDTKGVQEIDKFKKEINYR